MASSGLTRYFVCISRLPPKQLESQHASPTNPRTEESIRVKIRKANMLIDRVKEALDGIKFKDKDSSTTCTDQEHSTQPNTATTDSDKENDCCFVIQQSKAQLEGQMRAVEMGLGTSSIIPMSAKTHCEASRPKTRRCECSEDQHNVEERYRTTPGIRAPAVSVNSTDSSSGNEAENSLQLLKEKLNAISEQATETTESENEKTPAVCVAACNTLTIETTTSATNTDPPCTMSSKESQWSPCGLQKGTQSFTPAAEKSLQTDQKKKAPLATFTVENAVIPPKSCQVKNLVIQTLPPIDVKIPHRRMQSLLHYSIENNQTNLLFKNDICNVAFQLAKSSDLTDDPELVPVKPEPSTNLLKIIEKGMKKRSSAVMGIPDVARKILELEHPEAETFTTEDEEEDDSKDTSKQESVTPSPVPLVLDMNTALRMTDTKRSISEVIQDKDESQACLFTNKLQEKTSFPGRALDAKVSPEREKVLRSYHVYDNVNAHDPGILNSSSLEFVSRVDENVYKTYINPSGFQKPLVSDKSNQNIPTTNSVKKCGLSLLSSLKVDKPPSDSRCSTTQEAVPKIWSLGFYANKSTQVETPSETRMERSSRGEVQQEENPGAEEEKALKVTNFTHSVSRLQLTNEEDRPAQMQAERDEDPAYERIGSDDPCHQWAADLRTAITSIRKPTEEPEVEKGMKEEPQQDIPKETRSTGCNCSLLTSKADVHISQNTLETKRNEKQKTISREMVSPKASGSGQPSSKEQTSDKNSEATKKPDEVEGNEDNKSSPSNRIEKSQSASPKQSGKAEDGSQTTVVEYRTMNGSHLETISLTVSYNTGDSVEVNSPAMQNSTTTSPTRDSTRFSALSNSQKTKFQLNNSITEEGKVTLRAIKDKLDLEHGEQSKPNLATETVQPIDQIDVCEEVTDFISGLTQHSSGELKRVIPIIRSRKSLSRPPKEKSKSNRTFDVNYVIGDFRQPNATELLTRKSSKLNKDHSKEASNGRCKDEAQPFSKFNEELGASLKPKTPPTKQAAEEKPKPQIARKTAKHSGNHTHKHKHKQNFKLETTSNSETITTERSKSEGELTSCQCAVSFGELHSCRYDQFHRMNPPIFNDAEDLVTTIRKKGATSTTVLRTT